MHDCRMAQNNIISQGFLMAEDLNGYFSSVFTKEDISSLPVADAKFQGAKSDYLGPLVVTPELVAKKIKAMKYGQPSHFPFIVHNGCIIDSYFQPHPAHKHTLWAAIPDQMVEALI